MTITWLKDVFLPQLEFPATVFAIALGLELLLPASRKRSWRALGFNLVVALIFLYLTALIVPYFAKVLEPVRKHFSLMLPVRLPDGIAGSMLQAIVFFFVFDFFFYWWHRAQHRMHWLWVQHKFHHQERWLNVTTVHRYHFTEEIFRVFVILLPMAVLFDFKPVTVGWTWTIFMAWGYWIHANLRIHLGPLGRWLSGPQFHRLHHTPEAMNHNFAAFFPLWDRLFGTFRYPERGVFPEITGVRNATDGNTLREAVVYPFVEWAKAIRRLVAVRPQAARH